MRRPMHATFAGTLLLAPLVLAAACGDDGPVAPGDAATVTLSSDAVHLAAIGAADRLSATVSDANGIALSGVAVSWSSADEDVATADADGWAMAQANGTTAIEAAVGEITDEAAVRVEQVVASVQVSPSADSLGQGETVQLGATALDANGTEVAGATVVWTTSDPAVATVNAAGRVTGTGWGRAVTIAAEAGGASGAAELWLWHQIAYQTDRDHNPVLLLPRNFEIYVIDADGTGHTRITWDEQEDADPTWSPDGSRLAFFNRGNDLDIHVVDADGCCMRRLTDNADGDTDPAWSPDGSTIAFVSDRDANTEIYAIGADGSAVDNLTGDGASDFDPAWSPDGSRIAFASTRDPGDGTTDHEIWVMDADGSNPEVLTSDAFANRDPAWSPDGSRIAFDSNRNGDWEVLVMDADGSNVEQLTDNDAVDRYPAWSPDGSRIAFSSDQDGNADLYVMDADGSNLVRITDDAAFEVAPAWRPVPGG